MWLARAALVLMATVLTACASGPRTIDAEVRTNAAQPPGHAVLQGAHYRFERGQLVAGSARSRQARSHGADGAGARRRGA